MKIQMTDDEKRQHQFYEQKKFWNAKGLANAKLNTFVQIDGVD